MKFFIATYNRLTQSKATAHSPIALPQYKCATQQVHPSSTIVRSMILLTGITCTLLAQKATAQSSYLIRGGKEEILLNRLEIKLRSNTLGFSAIKPYNRKAIVDDVERFDSLYNIKDSSTASLTATDKYNMQRLLMNNAEWSKPREIYKSEKPILKTFYQSRGNLFEMKNSDFTLIANPIIQYQMGTKGGNSQTTFINQRGLQLRGIIGQNLGFDFYFTENQERQPVYMQDWVNKYNAVPGAGYIKSFKTAGYDYFDVRGSMTWKVASFMDMQFGYDRNFIGNGFRSLLLSDFSTNALFLKINTHFGRFRYENIFMELVSLHRRGSDYIYPRNYFRVSYLSYNATKWLNVGLFDGVKLGKTDELSLGLFNPVIFAHIPNGNSNPVKDKYYTGLDIKANIAGKVQAYGQLMVDRVKPSELSNKWWGNKYGYQLGAKYVDAFGLQNVDVQVETNRIRPFTYSSNDSATSYTHYNQPLAHPLGANFEEYIGIVRAQPMKKLYLEGKLIYYKQGLDSAGVNMGQNPFKFNNTKPREYGWDIGTGDLAKCTIITLLASYEIRENLFIEISYLRRNYSQASKSTDNNINVVSAGVRWNIGRREFLF